MARVMAEIAKGLQLGFEGAGKAKRQMDEDARIEERQRMEKERFGMDLERFGIEKARAGREMDEAAQRRRLTEEQIRAAERANKDAQDLADASKELAETRARIRRERASGEGAFSQFLLPDVAAARASNRPAATGAPPGPMRGFIPPSEFAANPVAARGGIAPPPVDIPAAGASPAAIAYAVPPQGRPPNLIPTPPTPVRGIAVPGAAPAAATQAAPAEAAINPFRNTGQGMYRDISKADELEDSLVSEALQSYYERTRQPEKAMLVPKMFREFREQRIGDRIKAASAGLLIGAPDAIQSLNTALTAVGAGSADPKSGQYDPEKKTWTGVRFIDASGKEAVRNIGPAEIMQIAQWSDPVNAIKWMTERQDKERSEKREETRTANDTTRAGAAVTSANAAAANAKTAAARAADDARTNASTRDTNEVVKKSAAETRATTAAQNFFISAAGVKDFQVKTADEVKAMLPEQRKKYEEAREKRRLSLADANAANALWSLNDRKLDPGFIWSAYQVILQRRAQGKGEDGTDPETGLPYVNINGKKVLLPKD